LFSGEVNRVHSNVNGCTGENGDFKVTRLAGESILTSNGYVDLKPFAGPPFPRWLNPAVFHCQSGYPGSENY